jgi:enolase-phosphatase E1
MVRAILIDIEGTTTPIAFVYDVLFPFARLHFPEYLKFADLTDLQREYDEDVRKGLNPPSWSPKPIAYIYWLMDQDRKSTALKRMQGEIWREGYENGRLHGEVFPDVPVALQRWQRDQIDVRIFSSGSVLAQRLLFATTTAGDLTRFLHGYFDTATGAKNDPESYHTIAKSFGIAPSEILFISDVTSELDAARDAGMKTTLCVRPGNHPQPEHNHAAIATFETV